MTKARREPVSENADTRVVQHTESARQARPLVMREFNELESMKVVCVCVCANWFMPTRLQRSKTMLIRCVAATCAKTDAGWALAVMDHIPPHTLSQIQLRRGPPTPIYSTEELQQIAFEFCAFLFCIPAEPRPTFRMGGYKRETAGLSAEEWSLAA